MPFPGSQNRPRGSPLSAEQLRNARLIWRVGTQMGMSNRDIQIGLITAMQESSLRNLRYGDRDSLGLFQQRPSQGWGSPEQVTDPIYASRKFFSTLKSVKGRQNMRMTEAAQAVQRSAYPNAYAKHIPTIRSMYPKIMGKAQANPGQAFGGSSYQAPSPGDVYAEMYDEYGYQPDDTVNMASVLGPAYNPVLEAPNFADWDSPLSQGTFDLIRDEAVSRGDVGIGRGVDGWRGAVVDAARGFVGTPYVWGGTSPNGFDCSGLVQYVFGKAGIDLPRVSYQQANSGRRIGLKGLRPGDLVAWDNSSRNNGADHIAIYIGNGRIIEAPRPGLGVRVRKLGRGEGAWGVRIKR